MHAGVLLSERPNGRGVALSDVEAAQWYRKAAEQGFAVAQQGNLGIILQLGEGVAKNVEEAGGSEVIGKGSRQRMHLGNVSPGIHVAKWSWRRAKRFAGIPMVHESS